MFKLDAKAFGLALGIVWGGITFLLGILDMLYFWGNSWGKMMTMVYLGYNPTLIGCIIAAVWGFVYAWVFGFMVALMYNRLVEENKAETEERIKALAKKIWERKGRPANTSADDWREAERIIKGNLKQ
ncbi:MAG: bacteriophage holin [Candidatus Omnitrophica bacterium]|nr:bacteriophage holin [Candidatus Omnitrophota bacterium]